MANLKFSRLVKKYLAEMTTQYLLLGKMKLFVGNKIQLNILISIRCGTFSIYDPNCAKWERDFSKPYPECCNAFDCVEYSKNTSEIQNNLLDES